MKRLELTAAALAVVVACGAIELPRAQGLVEWLGWTLFIAASPVTAWPMAAATGPLTRALWLLVPTTLAWAIPLAIYLHRSSLGCLGMAVLMWLAASVLLGIAVHS